MSKRVKPQQADDTKRSDMITVNRQCVEVAKLKIRCFSMLNIENTKYDTRIIIEYTL